jgi:hypothetical protein
VLNPSCDNIKPYHLYCVRGCKSRPPAFSICEMRQLTGG